MLSKGERAVVLGITGVCHEIDRMRQKCEYVCIVGNEAGTQ